MKFKTLITVNSVLSLIFGILCMLMPAQMLANYDVSLSPMGLVIYQFWGVALIGLGMLMWFIGSTVESGLQLRFALALFITNGLNCVMAIQGQFAGANTFGWSTVALFFLLTLSFGIFMILKPRI